MTGGGTNLSFYGNTLDTCCFESSDVGSFYVCGQGGTAFWGGRGGVVRNNTFIHIRNLDGTGVQGPSVQALVSCYSRATPSTPPRTVSLSCSRP